MKSKRIKILSLRDLVEHIQLNIFKTDEKDCINRDGLEEHIDEEDDISRGFIRCPHINEYVVNEDFEAVGVTANYFGAKDEGEDIHIQVYGDLKCYRRFKKLRHGQKVGYPNPPRSYGEEELIVEQNGCVCGKCIMGYDYALAEYGKDLDCFKSDFIKMANHIRQQLKTDNQYCKVCHISDLDDDDDTYGPSNFINQCKLINNFIDLYYSGILVTGNKDKDGNLSGDVIARSCLQKEDKKHFYANGYNNQSEKEIEFGEYYNKGDDKEDCDYCEGDFE